MSSEPLARAKSVRAVPMLDLAAQHSPLAEEILESFAKILSSGRFVLGETVEAFEASLARFCGTKYAATCNSGTDSLWLALRALGIGPGDAVICPAFSFFATAAAIVRAGATPVLVDIDPVTFNLNPEETIRRARATPNLRAIVTVDLFGRLAELGPLADFSHDNGIPIIEDAAQAIDAIDAGGYGPGHNARVACLSFYPTKNLGALGDAGAIVTNDPGLYERITRLRVHGQAESGLYEEIGINSRMDALQAAALSVKLRHLDEWTRTRRALALHYDASFASRANDREGPLPLVTPAPVPEPGRHGYHRYIVRVPAECREELIHGLHEEGIASEIYYPLGLHQQPALVQHLARTNLPKLQGDDSFPETERATREALALPLYPELAVEDVERVVDGTSRLLRRIGSQHIN